MSDFVICLSDAVHCGKQYIPQQKWLNKWIGSALPGTRFYNFEPPNFPSPNFKIYMSGIALVSMLMMAIPDEEECMCYVEYIMLTWRTCMITLYCLCAIFSPKNFSAVQSAISATATCFLLYLLLHRWCIILCCVTVGLPAITLPVTLSSNQLPIGLQLIGRHFDEQRLLLAAKGIEQLVDFRPLSLHFLDD